MGDYPLNDFSDGRKTTPSNSLVLIYFLLVVIGVGFLLGFLFRPDDFYAGLVKPFFNPPNVVFGPVWTVLYLMIAVAGWRVWRVAPKSIAMLLWGLQMVLNWLWTPIFFMAHNITGALIVILFLLVTILLFIIRAPKHDKIAAWLFIPYALWVGFATILNAAIVILN